MWSPLKRTGEGSAFPLTQWLAKCSSWLLQDRGFSFFQGAGGSPQLQQVIYISLPRGGPLQVLLLLRSQQGRKRDPSNTGVAILCVVIGSCNHIDVISPTLSPCAISCWLEASHRSCRHSGKESHKGVNTRRERLWGEHLKSVSATS